MTKKIDNKSTAIAFLSANGWVQKRSYTDNFYKTISDKEYRVSFKSNVVRLEVKVNHEASLYSPASSSWVKIDGAYYKDIKVDEKGLRIGRRRIKSVV